MSFKERVKQKILICVVSEKSLLTPSFDRNCFFLIRKVKPPIFHFVWKMYAQILKEIACTEFKREYYHENCLRGLFWGDCNFITLNWNVYHIKHFTYMKREDYMYSKYIKRCIIYAEFSNRTQRCITYIQNLGKPPLKNVLKFWALPICRGGGKVSQNLFNP